MTMRRIICTLAALVLGACQQAQQGQTSVNVIRPEVAVVETEAQPQEDLVPSPMSGEKKTEESSRKESKNNPSKQELLREQKTQKASKKNQGRVSVKPIAPRRFVPSKPGFRVAQVNVPGNYVALTFDDGPSASYTPQVLDILKRHKARATFFVLGENAVRNKSLLARAVAEGHEIANHTYSHIKMTAVGRQTIAREIERTSDIIKEATGYYPTAMRPPYGAINSELVDMVYSNYGMHAVLWDVDTRDWQHPGVSTVVNRAVNKSQPGSIILLHDIHASTLAAVEEVVTGLQARGFKLVTVSQLIEMGRRAAAPSTPAPVAQPVGVSSVETGTPVGDDALPVASGAAEVTGSAAEPTSEEPQAMDDMGQFSGELLEL